MIDMLIDDIVRFAPGAELDVTRFTSGAFDITVRYRGRAFVVAFVRELGYRSIGARAGFKF